MLDKCECVKDTASDQSKVIHKFECHIYTIFKGYSIPNQWLDALEMYYMFVVVIGDDLVLDVFDCLFVFVSFAIHYDAGVQRK